MEGEVATIRAHPKALVLRVPILYGFVEKNSECSISMLYDNIKVCLAINVKVWAIYLTV